MGGVINVIPRIVGGGFAATLFGEGGEHGWQRYQGDITLGSGSFGLYLSGLQREGEGEPQKSFDKQFVRDYLLGLKWDQRPPAPKLPHDVVRRTSEKYLEVLSLLTS